MRLYKIPVIAGDCILLAKFIRERRQTISLTLIMVTGREGLIVTPSKICLLSFFAGKQYRAERVIFKVVGSYLISSY